MSDLTSDQLEASARLARLALQAQEEHRYTDMARYMRQSALALGVPEEDLPDDD